MTFSEKVFTVLLVTFAAWVLVSGWAVANGLEITPLNFWYYIRFLIEILKR